jgi:ribosomal protein L37AE/L43A
VEITCPFCSHRCRTDRQLGKGALVRCPACQSEFAFAGFQPSFVVSSGGLPTSGSFEPDTKPCPFCHETIKVEARKCRHCGETLDPVLRAAEEASRSVIVLQAPGFSPGIAMVLSLIWPGLGQIYRGKLVSGLMWMILTSIGYICFIIPGLILHLLCIIFAGRSG